MTRYVYLAAYAATAFGFQRRDESTAILSPEFVWTDEVEDASLHETPRPTVEPQDRAEDGPDISQIAHAGIAEELRHEDLIPFLPGRMSRARWRGGPFMLGGEPEEP